MQNPIQKFRERSAVFEKPGILSEKSKTLSSPITKLRILLLKLYTRIPPTNIYKTACSRFLFCVDLELFAEIKKDPFLHTHSNQVFYIFIKKSRSKQSKRKSPEHAFTDIVK